MSRAPGGGGVHVTFERGGRWRTLRVVERSHLELSLEVPELAGVRLRAHLGPATLVGEDTPVDDVRWRVTTDTPGLAAAIFEEPPRPRGQSELHGAAWPSAKRKPLSLRGVLTALGLLALSPVAFHAVEEEAGMTEPLPLYKLDLERGVVSIGRRGSEPDAARALGMVRRLLQVATWPERALGGMRALAASLGGEVEGERWGPGASAITLRRDRLTIRIDHELRRGALRTRIRVVDAPRAVAYVDGVGDDAELVRRTIDALVAQVERPRARGPYR